MASTSGCWHQFKGLQLFDSSRTMDDSTKKSDSATTTPAIETDHATPTTMYFSVMEEQIEWSKDHWSTLADHSSYTDEEEVDFEVSNKQEFYALQRHPTWGGFFVNFSSDCISTGFNYVDLGELVVGKKYAEGGQAELFEAQIKWNDPRNVDIDRRRGRQYLLKVFKEGTLLKHVKSQLPQGLLLQYVESLENLKSPTPKVFLEFNSKVYRGILLKGGRFAFLIQKQHFDLRTLVERNMKLKSNEDCGPFSKDEAEVLMYEVALEVDWLHNCDIVHRDLKASNVLVHEYESGWQKWECFVANYECSIGVVGTNFFRAPEILQACKERKVYERPEVFSKAVDIYSYEMTYYEILTGKLPFEDHTLRDSPNSLLINLVINQHLRIEVPTYIEDWTHELLGECWQFDPTIRLKIGEILNVLLIKSTGARKLEDELKERYGENFRS